MSKYRTVIAYKEYFEDFLNAQNTEQTGSLNCG